MYHDVKITTFTALGGSSIATDLYRDLYLVPNGLPVISPPKVKTQIVDIPGANGVLDLTESLTPYPTYENRQGSLEFILLKDRLEHYNRYRTIHGVSKKMAHDSSAMWSVIYSRLLNLIHGRRCQMILLDDDPDWYYEGRLAVNSWKSSNDGKWPIITIDYDFMPYKLSIQDSIELSSDNWLWSPFSFIDGVIYSSLNSNLPNDGLFKNIAVDSNSWVKYTTSKKGSSTSTTMNRDITGWMPVSPTFTFSTDNIAVRIVNPELGYSYEKVFPTAGTYTDPECILYDYAGNGYDLYFKGHGTVTVRFRKGSL